MLDDLGMLASSGGFEKGVSQGEVDLAAGGEAGVRFAHAASPMQEHRSSFTPELWEEGGGPEAQEQDLRGLQEEGPWPDAQSLADTV